MKQVTSSRTHWAIPVLAAVLAGTGLQVASAQAQPAAGNTATSTAAKTPRPRSKTLTGILSQASPTAVNLKAKTEDMNATLVPTTVYWRVETGLSPNDLKVGDTIRFTLRGTDGMPTVQSLSPLTLKFGDAATLTLDKPARMRFERASRLNATDLQAGQNTKVAANVFPDGKIEAREVWVTVKPVRTTN